MVSRMFPLPEEEYPDRFGELARAVQLKTAAGTVEVNCMLVVPPEQIDVVRGEISTSGRGLTVTTIS